MSCKDSTCPTGSEDGGRGHSPRAPVWPLQRGKGTGTAAPLEPPECVRPCTHLCFQPVRLSLDFCLTELIGHLCCFCYHVYNNLLQRQ